MCSLIQELQDKDDRKAYALSKEICAKSAESDEYYTFFDGFASLMSAKSSFLRTRGFVLCCAQSRWDAQGKLQAALEDMLRLLHDDKPTVVRQCLSALHEVALYRPELCPAILEELARMDSSGYKDSMAPLIEKDIQKLRKRIE